MSITLKKAIGAEIANHIEELGQLRIQVFSEWPYLYDGDLEYEKKYLKTYSQSKNSFVFMVFDNDQLVGATTAIALFDETAEFQKPFTEKKISVSEIVYFGESLLLKPYRGKGLGKTFMQERMSFAKTIPGTKQVAFCAVQRDSKDPRKPAHAKPLDEFWKSMGFVQQSDMMAEYEWKDIGEPTPSKKKLIFWTRSL